MPPDDEIYRDTVQSFLTLFRYLRRYSRQIHESGQSGRQLSTLRYLLDNEPATMGSLSSYLYINESSTTELVAKLEQSGLARRRRSPADNRVVEVEITDEGRRLAGSTQPGGIPLLRERLRRLPESELRKIGVTFRKLNDLLGLREGP